MLPLNQLQFSNGATQLQAPTTSTTGGPVQGGATSFINNFNAAHPQMNFTTGDFQNAYASNPGLAYQMLQQGGGVFQDAVRQAMGWDQNQFANFVQGQDLGNKGAYQGYSPQQFAAAGATMAPNQMPGNARNGPLGDQYNAGQFNVGQGMNVDPSTGAGYGPLAQGGPGAAPGQPGSTTLGNLASGNVPTVNGGLNVYGGYGMSGLPGQSSGGGMGLGAAIDPAYNGGGGMGGSTNGPTSSAPNGPNSFNSGLAPIAGTQPNYPLDIGAYLNPMMQYALNNGIQTINNSAAAAGNLDSGNTMKELMDFGQGMASQNYNNAAQIAAGQQAFGYGVDNNDRNFAYNAMNNDRNFDLNALLGMGNLGMQGAGQQGINSRLLATILSQNAGAAGQLQAGGTIGTNNIVQQIIRNLTTQGSTPSAG